MGWTIASCDFSYSPVSTSHTHDLSTTIEVFVCPNLKGQCTPKISVAYLIERVLDTDSNEPSLASIRELEPSQKRRYKKAHDPHDVTTDDVRTA